MSEKQKLHTMLKLYENTVERNSNDIQEEEMYMGAIYPILDPRAQLPSKFPNIEEYINDLGRRPTHIKHSFENLTVVFSKGNVFYTFDLEDFRYYPTTLTVLDPNHFNKVDTQITFDLLKDDEIPENGVDWDTHYLINENRVLRVNLPDNNLINNIKNMEKESYDKGLEQYEDLVWASTPGEGDRFIDPRIEISDEFKGIKKYIKQLGEEPIAADFGYDKLSVIFPGGKVMYWYSDKYQIQTILPMQMIIYGVTAAPGERALRTEKLDTHIVFEIDDIEDYEGILPVTRENRFILEDIDMLLDISVLEPEDTNIKNYWVKE